MVENVYCGFKHHLLSSVLVLIPIPVYQLLASSCVNRIIGTIHTVYFVILCVYEIEKSTIDEMFVVFPWCLLAVKAANMLLQYDLSKILRLSNITL